MIKVLLPSNNHIMVNGKSVYMLYLMLKNQFNGKYDVVKYNWRIKVSDKAYANRKDKYFFEKLSEKYNLKELCYIFVSNLLANQDAWIGEISDSDALVFYRSYIGKMATISTKYEDDVKSIFYFYKKVKANEKSGVTTFGDIFKYNEKIGTSYIFKLLQSNIISYESFILLDSFMDLIENHDKFDSIVWSSYSKRLTAYKKLLHVDQYTAKRIFKEFVLSQVA